MYPKDPSSIRGDVQIFNTPCTAGTEYHVWNKPRGATFVQIVCIGGGGGGGGGFTRISGASGGGGGGGGSAAHTRAIFPAALIPDTLFISVASGGLGNGSGGGIAGNGGISYVSIFPVSATTTVTNLLVRSGAAATGGNASGSTAGGAGGNAGATSNASAMALIGMGVFDTFAGQAGTAGGNSTAAGTDVTISSGPNVTSGGAGGGGTSGASRNGGGYTAITNSFISQIRPTSATAGADGSSSSGFMASGLFYFGGCGGSSNDAVPGGAGGNGGYGSGGGGGGAGTTGGRGGDGGSGLVIITSF